MKKTELFLASLALIALVLKLAHLPGSNFILVISLSCLAMLYFYLGFALFNQIPFRKIVKKESYQGVGTWRIIGAIGAGIAFSQTLVGILFKLLHWQGALLLLQVGLISIALLAIIGFIRYAKSKAAFYSNLFTRVAILSSFGILLLII